MVGQRHPGEPCLMSLPTNAECRGVLSRIYTLYRDYFDLAEKQRRWRLREDIPWDLCNPSLSPALANVVHTLCGIEMNLPNYLSQLIPQSRASRGATWFLACWGYEESKHSLALSDWLLRSGQRTPEQLTDLESLVFSQNMRLPHDSALGMLCFLMVQERATWLTYKNLRTLADGRDAALDRLLYFISIDECAHYDFFRKLVEVYLEEDREQVLEQLRLVCSNSPLPEIRLFTDSAQCERQLKELRIFDADIYHFQVFEPILADLGLTGKDLRQRHSKRETMAMASIRGDSR